MIKRLLLPLLAVAAFTGAAHAQVSAQDAASPEALVKTVVNDVMASVKSDKDMQAGNIAKISALVEQKILPNANFQKTTQIAMGRNWSKATPEQQKVITDEFKTLLIRTYAGAIAQIRDQTVQYKPYRGSPDDTDATIRTQVINKGEPIQLDYRLEKTAQGWKVYDDRRCGPRPDARRLAPAARGRHAGEHAGQPARLDRPCAAAQAANADAVVHARAARRRRSRRLSRNPALNGG